MRLAVWLREIVSAGRFKSPMPAITKPHLNVGAQKNTVVGPNSRKQIFLFLRFIFFPRKLDTIFPIEEQCRNLRDVKTRHGIFQAAPRRSSTLISDKRWP